MTHGVFSNAEPQAAGERMLSLEETGGMCTSFWFASDRSCQQIKVRHQAANKKVLSVPLLIKLFATIHTL